MLNDSWTDAVLFLSWFRLWLSGDNDVFVVVVVLAAAVFAGPIVGTGVALGMSVAVVVAAAVVGVVVAVTAATSPLLDFFLGEDDVFFLESARARASPLGVSVTPVFVDDLSFFFLFADVLSVPFFFFFFLVVLLVLWGTVGVAGVAIFGVCGTKSSICIEFSWSQLFRRPRSSSSRAGVTAS